jgi:hypothetical protein
VTAHACGDDFLIASGGKRMNERLAVDYEGSVAIPMRSSD